MLPWFTHQGFSLEWQGNIYSLKSWFDDLQDLPLLISSTFSPCLQHLSLVDDLFLDCSLQPPSWLLPLPFGTFSSGGFLSWTTFPLKKRRNHPQGGTHWPNPGSGSAHLHHLVDLHCVESRRLRAVANVPWSRNFHGDLNNILHFSFPLMFCTVWPIFTFEQIVSN